MIIIKRKEKNELEEKLKAGRWVLLFGRRKTGKSFLVKRFIKWDDFFFVKRDRSIISEKEGLMEYDSFLKILKRELERGSIVVVDEFHRLGNDFLDFLHSIGKVGRLILISSTLFLSKKIFGYKSPILGLVSEMPLGLIDLDDAIKCVKRYKKSKKEILENAILVREPIAITYFDENKTARESAVRMILSLIRTVPALIGEIFLEEERSLSAVYEGVLRAVAQGKITSNEISDYLYARRDIEKNDPSLVQPYLKNLVDFGILRKIEVFGKKKFIYKHSSPLAWLYYYADEKYNISERTISKEELKRIVDEVFPSIVEDNVRMFLAKKFGLKETILQKKDLEIDCCLTRFDKPKVLVEIKWGAVSKKDVRKAEENLSKIKSDKKFLFVQDKSKIESRLRVMDVNDLL